ncbi:MAG: EAL domain-containing protein [Sphingomonadales bacterium]|nr:EAL domain-containing protein [Sphingomonadales bacterium]
MSTSPAASHRDLSVRMVLGLTHAGAEDWARMRALQYGRLFEATKLKVASHALAAVASIWLFRDVAPLSMIFGWALLLGTVVAYGARVDLAMHDVTRHKLNAQEFRRQVEIAALTGLVWVAPVAWFTLHAPDSARLELWAILALLLTVSAVIIPAAPMATVAFAGTVGLPVICGFVLTGALPMALITCLFVATIMLGTIETSRHFLMSRLGEAGVAERNEVVSLLLGEYEEGDADWLWETDTNRRVRAVSRRFAYALGMEVSEIDGQPFVQLLAGAAWANGRFHPSMHDLAERLKRRERFANLPVQVVVRGEKRWWELSGQPRFDEAGDYAGFHGVGSDVTQARASSEKIAWLARYDTLTGLPNRMMLTEALGEAMLYAEQWRTRCAFLMIDLDRFKAVNDTLGHLIGDQLLARVSDRLKSLMSETELCGRLGGDEFAVVIRDASDLSRVSRMAQAVIDRLSEPYTVESHTLFVGASVGAAIGPRDGGSVEELMRNADLALYRAKDGGGGQQCMYEPALLAQAEERRKIEFAMRHALDRNEFHLVFQPVVDTGDEAVVSFEALLRWENPELGTISPAKFVPVAEDTRLIVPIGDWVMKQACIQATQWPRHVKVAVNVSGEQLVDANFHNCVVSALAMANLPAQRLEIEVTESIFLRDAAGARLALERIMALGCSVALDDFGTGYSSLGYIRKLRFSTIKLDRSFVQGAAVGNRESLAVARAVVAMADSLEMATTAEGVETEAELALVRKLGCTKIQGYYYGRPMAAAETLTLFQKDRRKAG